MFIGKKSKGILMLVMAMLLVFTAACGSNGANTNEPANNAPANNTPAAEEPKEEDVKLSGTVEVDGSSTVYPLTEAVAEEFSNVHKDVRIPVGNSGTGGGFKRFCAGETDISNASRPIKDSEIELCGQNNIEYLELPVAFDGLSVFVNKQNDFVDYLTVSELHEIYKPDSTVKTWADVRENWPNEPIIVYSPSTNHGTFDYFTEVINGKGGESRNDNQITYAENNPLVQGVAGDKYSIGYLGYSYYEENQDKLNIVPIDEEKGMGPITPEYSTINDGTYSPLSRPIYIYVSKPAVQRPEAYEYVKFYLTNAAGLSPDTGFIALPQNMYDEGMAGLEALK